MTPTTTTARVTPRRDPRYHLSRRELDRLMREIPRGPGRP
jgi:hypothetical protein